MGDIDGFSTGRRDPFRRVKVYVCYSQTMPDIAIQGTSRPNCIRWIFPDLLVGLSDGRQISNRGGVR
jgi:hypothetical protein